MQRTTCEYMMWTGLPFIRREIAESMIKDFGLSQKEAAQKLGVTPAAVCQYISKKRGKLDIDDTEILEEIKISAEYIIKNGHGSVIGQTCKICKILRSTDFFDIFCKTCDE